jgi:hypothetical protein
MNTKWTLLSVFTVLLFASPVRADGIDTISVGSQGVVDLQFFEPSTITVVPWDGPFFNLDNVPVEVVGQNVGGLPSGFTIFYNLTFGNDPTGNDPGFLMSCASGQNVGMSFICDASFEQSFFPSPAFTMDGDQLTFIPGNYNDGGFTVTAPEPSSLALLAIGCIALRFPRGLLRKRSSSGACSPSPSVL